MSKSCKACNNDYAIALERQVVKGELSAFDAAKQIGIDYENYMIHLKTHLKVNEKKSSVVDTEDPGSVLKYLTNKLWERVKTLLATPTNGNPETEKNINAQVRLLKDLAMDIAELEHKIQKAPQILIQNYISQQQELTTFLISNLCPECRDKVLEYLKVPQK